MANSAHCRQSVVHDRMILIGADRDAFLGAVLEPSMPTEKLVMALKRHRENGFEESSPRSARETPMSTKRFAFALFVFVAASIMGQAGTASACTQQCQKIGPNFCRQCVDTGSFTGIACVNYGPCGCIFLQEICDPAAATALAGKINFLIAENSTPAQAPIGSESNDLFAGDQ